MKKIILILICLLLSKNSFAIIDVEVIASQFSSRNWDYHAAYYGRQAHLRNYANSDLISKSKIYVGNLIQKLDELTSDELENNFPEVGVINESERLRVRNQFQKLFTSYEVLSGWESFLNVIQEDQWSDRNAALCQQSLNPIENPDCGRRTKGNYAIATLTSYQRQSLSDFKEIVLDELELLMNSNIDFPVGPEAARVFQFLFDPRSIDRLLQLPYAKSTSPNEPKWQVINQIEILRSLIIQLFQDKNGEILDSNLKKITLEDPACLSIESSLERSECILSSLKKMFWDKNNVAGRNDVQNLIFDHKGIKPFFEAVVNYFTVKNPEYVSRDNMIEVLSRYYFFISYVYNLDPMSPSVSNKALNNLKEYLKISSEYLLGKRDFVSLQIARGLHELMFFVGEN